MMLSVGIRIPGVRKAAERRGLKTDDVVRTYLTADGLVTLWHVGGREETFQLSPEDYPLPCPHCGRS